MACLNWKNEQCEIPLIHRCQGRIISLRAIGCYEWPLSRPILQSIVLRGRLLVNGSPMVCVCAYACMHWIMSFAEWLYFCEAHRVCMTPTNESSINEILRTFLERYLLYAKFRIFNFRCFWSSIPKTPSVTHRQHDQSINIAVFSHNIHPCCYC